MPINLTLQGSMAAGKSTAVQYVARHCPGLHISYENVAPMLAEIKFRGLNQIDRDGFVEIQRIFIAAEIRCWEEAQRYPATLFDMGASEIEFYTLFFPRSIGMDWDMETLLHRELTALRRCKPDEILFLDASVDTLR
jgi:hypothetical protein